MNQRIMELAEQAVEETQLLMIMEYKNFESKLYEKFAELIINECANHAIDFNNNIQSNPDKVVRSNLNRVGDYIVDRMSK